MGEKQKRDIKYSEYTWDVSGQLKLKWNETKQTNNKLSVHFLMQK